MPVPSTAADLSTTAASNSPAGADAIGTSLDDYLRSIQAIIKQQDSKGSDIASATTIDVPGSGKYFVVTGTTTIAGISDDWNGRSVVLKFSGALQLTNSASFILPTSANITTVAGDCLMAVNESTGVWRVVVYQRADGTALGGATQSGIQLQSYTRFTVGGTADAMTGTLSPAITGYTAGLRVTTTPGGANTVTGPTLNLNSLGAKTIKKRNGSGAKVALAAGDYNASGPFDYEYDGTDFILLNPVPAGLNFLAYRSTNQTGIATATWTKVQLNAEQWDSRSTFDSATNYRWTPGVTGIAHVSLSAQFETATDGADLRVALYLNGSLHRASINYAVGTGQQTVTFACDAQVSAVTDYFEMHVYQATGSNRSLEQGADRTYFCGHML